MNTGRATLFGICFTLSLSTTTWAYDPDSKLECRKRLSPTQFLYFEVQPIALRGHPFELDLFENNNLIYQKTAVLGEASLKDHVFAFEDHDLTITVNEDQDFQSTLKIVNDPQLKNTIDADCMYFVPPSPEWKKNDE